jgi:hypothetical protein
MRLARRHGGSFGLGMSSAFPIVMTTTLGQLIATVYDRFEREYGDRAAIETRRFLVELLGGTERPRHRRRQSASHR